MKQQVVQKCAPQLHMSKPARLLHAWRTCNGDPTCSTGPCLDLDFTTYFRSGVISPLSRQSDRSQVLWVKCLGTFTCLPGVSHLWILCSNNNVLLHNHIIQTEYIVDVFLWGITHIPQNTHCINNYSISKEGAKVKFCQYLPKNKNKKKPHWAFIKESSPWLLNVVPMWVDIWSNTDPASSQGLVIHFISHFYFFDKPCQYRFLQKRTHPDTFKKCIF